ncbi:hypothetical protein BOSEA31B_20680 [Hyphomicrobiales bacterium]|nr:hypothetical protein BOSEA31B_20680 [Hyphomicrobiales bacterium]CAH1702824.1 hypothetical protein BOSEA1005_30696 [Hyphomicrobiales bacterium]CAI0347013.1 hypothetical protein BO1005MUT1_530189 [Hyphomicrobiales bacterium]
MGGTHGQSSLEHQFPGRRREDCSDQPRLNDISNDMFDTEVEAPSLLSDLNLVLQHSTLIDIR